MQLKPVQKASRSRVSNPPPVFVILEVKKIEPHYFVVVRPQSNQNQQKKSDLAFKSYGSQFGDVSHPTTRVIC